MNPEIIPSKGGLILPFFCALILSALTAPLAIWGPDQAVIYSQAYYALKYFRLPLHGTVSSFGTLFPPAMIWFALPYVAIFRDLVLLSFALMMTHSIILILCLDVALSRIEAARLTRGAAYIAAALYLVLDMSLIFTAANLWEQYVARTLVVALWTVILASIYSPRPAYFLISGFLAVFLIGIHPIPAILIPASAAIIAILAFKKGVGRSCLTFFILGALLSFLIVWLPWIAAGNLKKTVFLLQENISIAKRPFLWLANIFLAFGEWIRLLLSPSAGTVLHLPDPPNYLVQSGLTILLSRLLSYVRALFGLLTLGWCLFNFRKNRAAGYAIGSLYGLCYLAFFMLLMIGIMPFSERPDYGSQFLGLYNFAAAIGIYFIIRGPADTRIKRIMRVVTVAGSLCIIFSTLILALSVNYDVRHPKKYAFALIPASERMEIVRILVKNSGNKQKIYAYKLDLSLPSALPDQPKWLTESERLYEPALLFEVLLLRYGKAFRRAGSDEEPDFLILGPPEKGGKEKYELIYEGAYLSVEKKI
ncbi:MAG: hypothetical protein FJZ09_04550 [Candidatus Omnitrophica bacterium]|nr:hypothetical protein [Candidatus Omnitrophota bacterium]